MTENVLEIKDISVDFITDTGRLKAVSSIHRKMKVQRIGVDQVYDYIAFRIITQSIKEVVETLIIAILLVVFTVYIFLQDFRTTLVPAITMRLFSEELNTGSYEILLTLPVTSRPSKRE